MKFDPKIWGPYYWFFLHSICHIYPEKPNNIIKKKYYEFIMNLPVFIPDPDSAKKFEILLEQYPLTPYLDTKNDLIKWMHFIHNTINSHNGKPSCTLYNSINDYYENYKSIPEVKYDNAKLKYRITYACIILIFLLIISNISFR